jgi:hypothetical protein
LNGLRISEALGADITALGSERGHRTLTIVRKGGKIVTIPLAPRTARSLDLAIGERLDGPIFRRADGQRLDRHGAGRIVRRVAKRAGIAKPISPHTLRHAFITAALDAGVPLRDVQEAASHADPRTTMRYDRARASLDRHATYIVAPTSPAPPAESPAPRRQSARRTMSALEPIGADFSVPSRGSRSRGWMTMCSAPSGSGGARTLSHATRFTRISRSSGKYWIFRVSCRGVESP